MRISRVLCQFASDEFGSVTLPRQLVIKNTRLGLLYKALQVLFVIGMVVYCIQGEVWRQPSTAEGWSVRIWGDGTDPNSTSNQSSTHCADPGSYHFEYSKDWVYAPRGCKDVPLAVAFSKWGTAQKMFVTTLVQDNATWEGAGVQCSNETEEWCQGLSEGSVDAVYRASGGTCSCTVFDEYFAQDADALRIGIVHGYEADLSRGAGERILRGTSASMTMEEGPRADMKPRENNLRTIFVRDDGSPCEVGGQSEWSNKETLNGVFGTVREFLACAGVDLDSDPAQISSSVGLAPHFRTMGLALELHLHYTNPPTVWGETVVCTVRIVVTPMWSWRHLSTFVALPGPSTAGQSMLRSRYQYGLAISMKTTGQFFSFNMVKLMNAIVGMLVILQVPRYIVQFIAIYCLGLVSIIYRNAKRAQLNIVEHFHGAVARMVLAEIGFRGLLGGTWHGRAHELDGVPYDTFYRHLKDVFQAHIENGILQRDELHNMSKVIFDRMDVEGSGCITSSAFIRSCTANETIDVQSMALFFDDEQQVGVMRHFFDDTHNVVSREVSVHEDYLDKLAKTSPGPYPSESMDVIPVRQRRKSRESKEPAPGEKADGTFTFNSLDQVPERSYFSERPSIEENLEQRVQALEAMGLENRITVLQKQVLAASSHNATLRSRLEVLEHRSAALQGRHHSHQDGNVWHDVDHRSGLLAAAAAAEKEGVEGSLSVQQLLRQHQPQRQLLHRRALRQQQLQQHPHRRRWRDQQQQPQRWRDQEHVQQQQQQPAPAPPAPVLPMPPPPPPQQQQQRQQEEPDSDDLLPRWSAGLFSQVQQLDDAVTRLQADLGARISELETALQQEASLEFRRELEALRKAISKRLCKLEAQIQPLVTVTVINDLPSLPEEGSPPGSPVRATGSATPGNRHQDGAPGEGRALHSCLHKTLTHASDGRPVAPLGAASPPKWAAESGRMAPALVGKETN